MNDAEEVETYLLELSFLLLFLLLFPFPYLINKLMFLEMHCTIEHASLWLSLLATILTLVIPVLEL